MKISEFIGRLEKIKRVHGDLDVETSDLQSGRVMHKGPGIGYRKILTEREKKSRFFSSVDSEDKRGSKVCRV